MSTERNATSRPVAVVTGSATGIGAAAAARLASQGHDVVINYSRSADAARQTGEACERLGARALVLRCDVASNDDCMALVQQTVAAFGRIDALVNSAGITKLVPHHDLDGLSGEDFQRIYAVNCVGAFQMVRACTPHLRAGGRGAVVNVSAIAALVGTGSSIAYVASKGALNAMSLSLARALGPQIRVNVVCPGLVESRWMRDLHGERYEVFKAEWEAMNPLASTATADDVADAIAWLVTGASQVTGQVIALESGWLLGRSGVRGPRG